MALPRTFIRDINQEIARLYEMHRRDDETVSLNDVQEDFEVFIAGHPEFMVVADFCRAKLEEYDRQQRPDPAQPNFFDAQAWIPVGPRERVEMANATREHLIAYIGIETNEHSHQVSAYQKKLSFVNDALARWQSSDTTLGEVMARP